MTGLRSLKPRDRRWAIVALPVVVAAVVASVYGYERAALRAERGGTTIRVATKHTPGWLANQSRGVLRPPTVAAGASEMRDDEEVIGVEVGGRARAYRLDAFRDRTRHLVNDRVGGVPLSVVYCDLSDCVRVYTDPRGSAPMDVEVAGRSGEEMVVKLGGVLYFHKSGAPMEPGAAPIPFELLSPTRTTWKEWKRRHPETDVYEGERHEACRHHPMRSISPSFRAASEPGGEASFTWFRDLVTLPRRIAWNQLNVGRNPMQGAG